MTASTRHTYSPYTWLGFGLPFLLSLGAYGLTMLSDVGPGVAAGWANVLSGTGEPASAVLSPLYRLVLLTVGSIPISGVLPHVAAGWLNAILMAAATGFFSLLVYDGFTRLVRWGARSLSSFAGALAGVALLPWTVALTLNPAPLAVALVLSSLWLASAADNRRVLLSALLFGLAITAHAAVVFLLPIFIWFVFHSPDRAGWFKSLIALVLPLVLFLTPSLATVFNLHGLFSQAPNVPDVKIGIELLAWSKLHALTPVALLVVAFALVAIVRSYRNLILPVVIVLVSVVVAGLFPFSSDFAAVLAGFVVTGLTAFGLAMLFNRLPAGFGLVLWLLIPVFWLLHGPEVNRRGEDLWQVHARNVMATQRYMTMIATTDHERLLAPYLYMQRQMDLRPDLLLVDPTLLGNRKYLASFHLDTLLHSEPAQEAHAQLLNSLNRGTSAEEREQAGLRFFASWMQEAVETMGGGVMFSSDIDPGPEVPLVPEGMLWRWYRGKSYPFLFNGLDLGPIYRRENDSRPLVKQTVRDYAVMFVQRAEFLREESFTIKVADYIRWAVRIDPTYPPAADLAREFSIHGDPILLFPKIEPRIGPALPGVQQTVDE